MKRYTRVNKDGRPWSADDGPNIFGAIGYGAVGFLIFTIAGMILGGVIVAFLGGGQAVTMTTTIGGAVLGMILGGWMGADS